MDKKEIQEKLKGFKNPNLQIHYLEKVLKKPKLLKRDARFTAIEILADLNSQVKDYLNSAFLYDRIGKEKESKEQLINAAKFRSSNDSPLKSYEAAAKKLEKRGYHKEAKIAWKNAFDSIEPELGPLRMVTGISEKIFTDSSYKKAISWATKAGMYDKAREVREGYLEQKAKLEEMHKPKTPFLDRIQMPRAPVLERILARAMPVILVTTSMILLFFSGNKATGYFVLDETGTLNYPLLIASIIFILAITIIIKNKRKSKSQRT